MWVGLVVAWMGLAEASEPEYSFAGRIQHDLRFRILEERDPTGPWYDPPQLMPGINRNQLMLNTKFKVKSGRFRGVSDLDLVMIGYPATLNTLGDLSNRTLLEPYRLEFHGLYVEGRDMLVPGLDLRIGQQKVQFGVGDQFNPTNTFNPNDVEDVLLFGDQMANIMLRADYALGNWTATGVAIPVFKPSLIPSTGPLALASISRLPFYEEELRWRIHSEADLGKQLGYPTVIGDVKIQQPEPSLENMQYGFNIGGFVGMHDVALSYYNGFADVPIAVASHTTQTTDPRCRGRFEQQCIEGELLNNVTLTYPEIQVIGYNMSGEVNPFALFSDKLAPLGYRAEVAVVFPKAYQTTLTQDTINFGLLSQPAGEYDYALETPGGERPVVLDDTPYGKWVLGLDYTLGSAVYLNAQWVHGMLDEFGAGDNLFQDGQVVRGASVDREVPCNVPIPGVPRDETSPIPGEQCVTEILRARMSDLAVIGVDLYFDNGNGLIRLFTITDLTGARYESYDAGKGERVQERYGAFTKNGYSQVLYPMTEYKFGDGFALQTGALIQLGKRYTKFGDPANGGSFVYTQARYAF